MSVRRDNPKPIDSRQVLLGSARRHQSPSNDRVLSLHTDDTI